MGDQQSDQARPGRDSPWQDREPEDQRDPVAATVHESKNLKQWQLLGASCRGRSHAHGGTYREDAFSLTTIKQDTGAWWWAIAVADGAGSCKWSRVGSNLAVDTVSKSLGQADFGKTSVSEAINEAASRALIALKRESERRSCDLHDLSCTLLILLWIPSPDGKGGLAWTFQAGDGLIACADNQGLIEPLANPDSEVFAGQTHFLTSDRVQETWDSRFQGYFFPEVPSGLLVMSDGVADDLIPYDRNGPILVKELFGIRDAKNAGAALAGLLGYEKRGSFDDRTLVCGLRRDPRYSDGDLSKLQTRKNG